MVGGMHLAMRSPINQLNGCQCVLEPHRVFLGGDQQFPFLTEERSAGSLREVSGVDACMLWLDP